VTRTVRQDASPHRQKGLTERQAPGLAETNKGELGHWGEQNSASHQDAGDFRPHDELSQTSQHGGWHDLVPKEG
jgi:hypothetical protein